MAHLTDRGIGLRSARWWMPTIIRFAPSSTKKTKSKGRDLECPSTKKGNDCYFA